jgi:hypothetical protein
MSHRVVSFLTLVSLVLAASTASADRAVIFRDPGFPADGPLKHGAAFVVRGLIDIRSILPDVVAGFGGDYAAGEAHTRVTLTDILAGRRKVVPETSSITADPSFRMNLVDLRVAAPGLDVSGALASSADSLGVTHVSVARPDSLREALSATHSSYLIVIDGLIATRDVATLPPSYLPGFNGLPGTMTPGSTHTYVTLAGRVFVFRADSTALIWDGFVSGSREIGKYKKSAAEQLAQSFVQDLQKALGGGHR